ncbi:MAG TPA: hypothetical protein EYP16_04325 [Candidatus Atribacteria bacterium]|nr:hypothetical protein [Candidatus Atribacteria bacterium]
MKELTSRHLNIVKKVETQRFIDESVADMHELNISPSYPEEKSKYEEFVKLTLKVSHNYGLTTEKDCYAYIMAWHVLGKDMPETRWLMDVLEDDEAFPEDKREALVHATYEILGKEGVS